jgi:hypothetical protein
VSDPDTPLKIAQPLFRLLVKANQTRNRQNDFITTLEYQTGRAMRRAKTGRKTKCNKGINEIAPRFQYLFSLAPGRGRFLDYTGSAFSR